MAVDLATGYVNLVPSARDIGSQIADELDLDAVAISAGKSAGDKIADGLLGQTKDTGEKLLKALGLAALGGLALKSAHDVEGAQNIIIRSTGATGKAQEDLEASFRKVAAGSSASLDVVATTLSDLYRRTGLQGQALEGLTKQVVTFNRISEASPITVESLTKATAGFNVQGDQMGKVLDHLFIISQKTGVPLEQLLGDLQTGGPVLRQFGFDIDFSAGFLAKLNKAGLDANQILPGLKKVLQEAAQEGKAPAEALRDLLGQLEGLIRTGDVIEARSLAQQIFGSRGTGLVDAVISGKLSLQDLDTQVKVTGDGIIDTAGKTSTLSGTLGVLRNNATLAFAGFATPALQVANDTLKDILPTVQGLSRDFADLPDGIQLGAVAAVGLAFGLGKVGEFVTNAGPGIVSLGHLTADGFVLASVKGLELLDTMRALSTSQLLLGGGIGIAAAAAVALSFALAGDTNKLTEAEAAAKKWGATTIAAAKASGDEYTRVRSTVEQLKTRQRELASEHSFLNDKVALTKAVYGQLGDEIQRDAEEFLKNKDRLAQLSPELEKLAQKRRDEGASARETAAALDRYTTSTENGTNASSALSKLTDDAKQALDGLQSALIQAAGGEVGYQEAILTRDEAQERANTTFLSVIAAIKAHDDAIVQFGEDSDQARATEDALTDAQRENARAQLELKQASLNLGQATIALTDNQAQLLDSLGLVGETREQQLGGIDAEIAKYQQLQRDYPATADSLNPYLFQLIQLKQKIEEVPTEHNTTLTANVDQALAAIASVNFSLATALSGATQDQARAILQGIALASLATGGIVDMPASGGPALLHGEEAVLPLNDPRRSWTIIAQAGLLAAGVPAPAGTSGDAPLIGEWHVHGDVEDPVTNAIVTGRSLRALTVLEKL